MDIRSEGFPFTGKQSKGEAWRRGAELGAMLSPSPLAFFLPSHAASQEQRSHYCLKRDQLTPGLSLLHFLRNMLSYGSPRALSLTSLCKGSSLCLKALGSRSRQPCRLSCRNLHRLSPRPWVWGLRFQDRNLGIWHRSADDVRKRGCKSGTEGPQAGGTAELSSHFVICGQYQKTVQTSNTKTFLSSDPLDGSQRSLTGLVSVHQIWK